MIFQIDFLPHKGYTENFGTHGKNFTKERGYIMKKKQKTILALFLCILMAAAAINADTACAARAKVPIKFTFKGKTVTLMKDINKDPVKPNVKTLKSKWGKPEIFADHGESAESEDKPDVVSKTYEWEKGNTTVRYNNQYYKEPMWASSRTYIEIRTSDKNVKAGGLKVGMKEKEAKKILKKLGAKQEYGGGWYTREYDSHSSLMISINCENGKVTYIIFSIENIQPETIKTPQ